MKTTLRATVATFAATGAVLTGCGSEATPSPSIPALATSSSTAETTTTAAKPTSPRGGLIKELGELGGYGCSPDTGVCDISFAITELEILDSCTGPIGQQQIPDNGQFLRVKINVATASDPIDNMSNYVSVFKEHEWRALDQAGITRSSLNTSTAYMCAMNTIPTQLSPASQYEFEFFLDVPTDTSRLIFAPFVADGDTWEWALRPTV